MHEFDLIPVHNELTMDSRDIAKLTGKSLGHINRDIKNMLIEIYGDSYQLDESKNGFSYFIKSYTSDNNRQLICYLLNQELTLTLLAGYSVKLRNFIIKKWLYLEKQYKHLRKKSIEIRNDFTETLKEHGYTKAHHYIQTTKQMKKALDITNEKDNMTSKELDKIKASEALASCLLDDEQGYYEVNHICVEASEIVKTALAKKIQSA